MGAALHRPSWPARLGVVLLAGALFFGSVVLVAMPLASLWLLSQFDFAYTEVYLLAFIACPVAVLAWGIVLVRLNRIYLQLAGDRAWPALEVSITAAVLLAIAAVVASPFLLDSPGVPLGP